MPAERYIISRRGSVYNIFGPEGRVFRKYRSASVVGPRWEELTHTLWPYPSTAYSTGQRLWELGLIARENVGAGEQRADPTPAQEVRLVDLSLPALPPPPFDLGMQQRVLAALRRDPRLLTAPMSRAALEMEVEYQGPHAPWAAGQLAILNRYERRERQRTTRPPAPRDILARHVAWQEQRARRRS